jgi:hypothetical protein
MPDQSPIEALIERAGRLTLSELTTLAAAWSAAGASVGDAACAAWAAGDAAGAAAGDAAWDAVMASWAATWSVGDVSWAAAMAARAAALATALRDQLTQEHYRALTGPWARVIGRVHPDDPDDARGDHDA